jgi:NAD(P)-dependent dehydrogenase (short-subunit alcohol dehydrogenase family)
MSELYETATREVLRSSREIEQSSEQGDERVSEPTEDLRRAQRDHVASAVERYRDALGGRVVVVTGGARGLGRCLVEGLLGAGASVASIDRSWAGAEDFEAALGSDDHALALVADITDDAALDRAFADVMERFGRVDVLVNNAGLVSETLFAPLGHVKLLDTKDSDWEAMFKVNVFGTIKVIRRFVEPMRAAGQGSIMNIVSSGVLMTSSGGGYYGARPWTTEMPYQATKSALTTAAFYLGQELFSEGIAVNSIMPGHTRASWFDATARAFLEHEGGIYFMRPLVSEHMVPIVLFLGAQAGARPPVTGRLYHAPDWNYDHGYGDYRVWGDHDVPEEVERGYRKLESALPRYWRSGLARAPFDVERVAFGAAMEKLELMGDA